ncbi:glutathione S-transferase omega-1 isoform X1 [Dermochelys coriacea]|uniref:glutathione S-transferase omega-1 isoform X1 n=1 Tax=Dermochelys coriacea TaxID=27794 RepID=UPI001CAA3D1D|nr:glutathione S-transferase omega-1 isoform X1 [Dermochelys coriacea]
MAGERARSLGKGSTAPGPVPEGLIRVYSMRFCPFAERTRLVLKAKDIKHETINVNLKNKPDWLFEKNPFGLVPILETSKGQLIYESLITCEYLDEAYPGKKLLPADPYERACQKMLLERFSKLQPLAFKHLLAVKNGEDSSALKVELIEKLGEFEEILAGRKTVFCGGDSVSMIDYMIWPWFERLEFFQLPNREGYHGSSRNQKQWAVIKVKYRGVCLPSALAGGLHILAETVFSRDQWTKKGQLI